MRHGIVKGGPLGVILQLEVTAVVNQAFADGFVPHAGDPLRGAWQPGVHEGIQGADLDVFHDLVAMALQQGIIGHHISGFQFERTNDGVLCDDGALALVSGFVRQGLRLAIDGESHILNLLHTAFIVAGANPFPAFRRKHGAVETVLVGNQFALVEDAMNGPGTVTCELHLQVMGFNGDDGSRTGLQDLRRGWKGCCKTKEEEAGRFHRVRKVTAASARGPGRHAGPDGEGRRRVP